MSSTGRGRGYPGRHHLQREPRPGVVDESGPARTLPELSPRVTGRYYLHIGQCVVYRLCVPGASRRRRGRRCKDASQTQPQSKRHLHIGQCVGHRLWVPGEPATVREARHWPNSPRVTGTYYLHIVQCVGQGFWEPGAPALGKHDTN